MSFNRTILGWKRGSKQKRVEPIYFVLIEPFWGGNLNAQGCSFFTATVLIEPFWGGNMQCAKELPARRWSFNRTILGWKQRR